MEVKQAEDKSASRLATISQISCYEAGYIHYPLNPSDANNHTRDIQRKFDVLISRFKSIIGEMTVDELKEIVTIIPDSLLIYFQDIQSVNDFFLRVRTNFTWLDETILKNLGEHLHYTGPEVDDYRRDLKQYFEDRIKPPEEICPVLPTVQDHERQRDRRILMLHVDDAWDREILRDHTKCEQICCHIVAILGVEARHITGHFDQHSLRIFLHT